MNDFLEKWKNDKKYQAKIKLILYGVFILFVSVYAISANRTISNEDKKDNEYETKEKDNITHEISTNYSYDIVITIDDRIYNYNRTVLSDQEIITKERDQTVTKYIYKDNEYYLMDNDIYVKTTKEEVYDIINYNYINIDTIKDYLSKAIKNDNQYLVYLKDIILDDDSEDYITIITDETGNRNYNIDYTSLMKRINSDIQNYKVDITVTPIV